MPRHSPHNALPVCCWGPLQTVPLLASITSIFILPLHLQKGVDAFHLQGCRGKKAPLWQKSFLKSAISWQMERVEWVLDADSDSRNWQEDCCAQGESLTNHLSHEASLAASRQSYVSLLLLCVLFCSQFWDFWRRTAHGKCSFGWLFLDFSPFKSICSLRSYLSFERFLLMPVAVLFVWPPPVIMNNTQT